MIQAIADRHGLAVVEDACQAHGAMFRGPTRQLRPRGVQPVRDEEHDDRRGRPHHHERRPSGRLDPALPEPGHAGALPPRDARLQLPDDRHRGRDRARPVRQARAEHGPPATIAARYDDGARGTCRRGCRSRRTAGPTSSTSTRSTWARSGRDRGRPAGRGSARTYYPDPRPPPAVHQERGIHADLPITDAAAADAVATDVPGLTDAEQDTVIAPGRGRAQSGPPAATRRGARRSMTRVAPAADRPCGSASPASERWAGTISGSWSSRRTCASWPSPTVRGAVEGERSDRRPAFAEPSRCSPRPTSMRWSSPHRRRPTLAARAGGDRARRRRPRREAARGNGRGGTAARRPRRGGRGARPGRPRRAVQPGGARARPIAPRRPGCRRSTPSPAVARARSRPGSAMSA